MEYRRLLPFLLAALVGFSGVSLAGSEEDAPASDGSAPSVGMLLDRLEEADDGIETLRATILYEKRQALMGDSQVRKGTLYYASGAGRGGGGGRVFGIHFETLSQPVDGGWREDEDRMQFAFDGRWLIRKEFDAKLYKKIELAPPGSDIDPLTLSDRSIAIVPPIGQKKDEILSRFEVSLTDAAEGLDADAPDDRGYLEYVESGEGSHQLVLRPRDPVDEKEAGDVVRLWYERGTLLPRLAMKETHDGDVMIVQLAQVELNEPLPDDAVALEQPGAGSGWNVEVEEGRFRDDQGGSGPGGGGGSEGETDRTGKPTAEQ